MLLLYKQPIWAYFYMIAFNCTWMLTLHTSHHSIIFLLSITFLYRDDHKNQYQGGVFTDKTPCVMVHVRRGDRVHYINRGMHDGDSDYGCDWWWC